MSHRYALIAALADGVSTIRGYAPGADGGATLAALVRLGVPIERDGTDRVRVHGRGLRRLSPASDPVDAGNSGTTLRLLAGVVAAHPFATSLTGDASLRRRPMRRIMTPLALMGAHIEAAPGDRPPLTIWGGTLRGITYTPEVPSAQVKSTILLAGLQAEGPTTVCEAAATRNHTELALEAFGADVTFGPAAASVRPGRRLAARDVRVPGDLSSFAFWAAAAAALEGSLVECTGVGLNPTRTAFLDVLARMGAEVEQVVDGVDAGEPSGSVTIRGRDHRPIQITPAEVPALIDELPALAALATSGGALVVTGASELRVKESDRIGALVAGLRSLGAEVEERPDGFEIDGRRRLRGGTADAAGDHRLAMAFAIAAIGASGPSTILGASAVDVSYPGFFDVLASLCA